jgi:soluble lytic murein transglycosylase-like protein
MDKHRWKAGGEALSGLGAALLFLLSTAADAQGSDREGAQAVHAAQGRQIERWSMHIAEASARFGIPENWIRRVMRAESGGRTTLDGRPITSRAGAMGLMQLMPGTWAGMRAKHALGPDPHDPKDNILAGAAYLRLMYDRFGYPGLFAAYNAGPERYARHLATGEALPSETIAYMAEVAPGAGRAAGQGPGGRAGADASPSAANPAGLFAIRPEAPAGAGEVVPPVAGPLFAIYPG